jgi:hypothetical protein
MTRFVLWTFWLLILCTVLTGGMIAYARANNDGNRLNALRLGLCNNRICVMGLQPGLNWDEVPKTLYQNHIATEWILSGSLTFKANGVKFYISPSSPRQTMDRLEITGDLSSNSYTFPRLGDFILQFGLPCNAFNQNAFQTFVYDDFWFNVETFNGQIRPENRMTYLRSEKPGICQLPVSKTFQWLGFRTTAAYFRR